MMKIDEMTQELRANEFKSRQELLDTAAREFGLEDVGTIELYRMDEWGVNYNEMLAYYKLYKASIQEDFGFND